MNENDVLSDYLDHIFSVFRHEWGNTVNSLKITLEVLLSNYTEFSDEKRIEFIERSMEQVDRQHRLLDKMKTYSHATVDHIQSIPLISFWNDIIQLIQSKIQQTPVVFHHQITASHVLVKTSLAATLQLIEHILNNSLDALDGVDGPQIDLRASLSDNQLILQIRDNGSGIAPDILPRIVLPFFSTRYDRAGLGLSIASKLMNQMDGRLSIASNVRQGTVVTLQFPIIPKQADIKQIHERKPLPC